MNTSENAELLSKLYKNTFNQIPASPYKGDISKLSTLINTRYPNSKILSTYILGDIAMLISSNTSWKNNAFVIIDNEILLVDDDISWKDVSEIKIETIEPNDNEEIITLRYWIKSKKKLSSYEVTIKKEENGEYKKPKNIHTLSITDYDLSTQEINGKLRISLLWSLKSLQRSFNSDKHIVNLSTSPEEEERDEEHRLMDVSKRDKRTLEIPPYMSWTLLWPLVQHKTIKELLDTFAPIQ